MNSPPGVAEPWTMGKVLVTHLPGPRRSRGNPVLGARRPQPTSPVGRCLIAAPRFRADSARRDLETPRKSPRPGQLGLGAVEAGVGAPGSCSSSWWWPTSAIRPRSRTTRRSALRRVLRRWAMAIVVRPWIRLSSASWISRSVSVSTDEVASSRIRIARVDQQGPGDRDPLPLAAGERLPALADQRVVAVGQAQDELVGTGGAGRGDDLVAGGARAGRRRCSRRSCRRTGTAPGGRCRCGGGTRRPGTSGRRRRRRGSPPRPRRRTGRRG